MASEYDSRQDTLDHIQLVRQNISEFNDALYARALVHDASKLESPEKEVFDRVTPKLRSMTYGSEAYRACLVDMKVGLDHHYANNDHHPEFAKVSLNDNHFRLKESREHIECKEFGTWATDAVVCMDEVIKSQASPFRCMSLLSITELLCDWMAAVKRHNDGSIRNSIQINQNRFGYSDEMKAVLLNTVDELERLAAKGG